MSTTGIIVSLVSVAILVVLNIFSPHARKVMFRPKYTLWDWLLLVGCWSLFTYVPWLWVGLLVWFAVGFPLALFGGRQEERHWAVMQRKEPRV